MMKLILSAAAFAFAVPAAAQTAPVQDHSQHQQAGHAGHGDQHKGHGGQGTDAKHECPMMKDGKKMACCEKHGDGKGKAPAAHGDHGGH